MNKKIVGILIVLMIACLFLVGCGTRTFTITFKDGRSTTAEYLNCGWLTLGGKSGELACETDGSQPTIYENVASFK